MIAYNRFDLKAVRIFVRIFFNVPQRNAGRVLHISFSMIDKFIRNQKELQCVKALETSLG